MWQLVAAYAFLGALFFLYLLYYKAILAVAKGVLWLAAMTVAIAVGLTALRLLYKLFVFAWS